MKFLNWLFNINRRHAWDIRNYEKGKLGTKILAIVLLFLLVGATLGIEYWGITLLKEDLRGLLVIILLLIPIAGTTLEFCGLYSYLGFKMFLWGTVESIAKKIDKKREQKKIESGEMAEEVSSEAQEVLFEQKKSEKSHKWIDLFVGILGIVLTIVEVVMIIVLTQIV